MAWFAVKVDNDHKLKAKVDDQGYVAIKNANLLFPAIGINDRGQAAIAFSISGPDFFPSAGYVLSHDDEGFGRIHIAAAGVNSRMASPHTRHRIRELRATIPSTQPSVRLAGGTTVPRRLAVTAASGSPASTSVRARAWCSPTGERSSPGSVRTTTITDGGHGHD